MMADDMLTTISGWVAALGTGSAYVWQKLSQGRRNAAATEAAIADYKADATMSTAAQQQIAQLLDRVNKLESKYSVLWDELQAEKERSSRLAARVRQLAGILREHSIPVPPEAQALQ